MHSHRTTYASTAPPQSQRPTECLERAEKRAREKVLVRLCCTCRVRTFGRVRAGSSTELGEQESTGYGRYRHVIRVVCNSRAYSSSGDSGRPGRGGRGTERSSSMGTVFHQTVVLHRRSMSAAVGVESESSERRRRWRCVRSGVSDEAASAEFCRPPFPSSSKLLRERCSESGVNNESPEEMYSQPHESTTPKPRCVSTREVSG